MKDEEITLIDIVNWKSTDDKTIERMAKHAHDIWSGWMIYLFQKSTDNPDGTVTIPKWAVDRWMRQCKTDYGDLPEEERESDRHEAIRMIMAIKRGE